MNFDFAAFLVFGTLGSGLVVLADNLWFKKRRLALQAEAGIKEDEQPIFIEYARSFFPVLLIVLCLRSFAFEPYRIPSGSMKPTLLVGDFILVNKYAYGVRLPVLNTKIIENGEPQRGDVMVFRYPVDPKMNFIKRVVGLPGDKIEYKDKQLYVNGELVSKDFVDTETFIDEFGKKTTVHHWMENLGQHKHEIYERIEAPGREVYGIEVPKGHYFMMGDNRDDSDDSRVWGFAPEENIVGKATSVWMSWNGDKWWPRFSTFPRWIS